MTRPLVRTLAVIAALFALAPLASAQSDQNRRFLGNGVDANWTTIENWDDGVPTNSVLPFFKTFVIFDAVNGLNTTNTLNIPGGITVHQLSFETATTSSYTINGTNAITFVGDGTNSGNGALAFGLVKNSGLTQTLNVPVNAGANTFFRNANAAGNLTLNGAVNLNAFTVTVDGVGSTTVAGVVSGAGGFAKNGAGNLLLGPTAGTSTYTGLTTINAGTVQLAASTALGGNGTVGSGTVVNLGGALDLSGRTIGNEFLTLSGTGVSSAGALRNSTGTASTSGQVTIAADNTLITTSTTGGITLSGGLVTAAARSFSVAATSGNLSLTGAATTTGLLTVNVSATTTGVGLRLANSTALGSSANVVLTTTTGGSGETGTRLTLFSATGVSVPAGVSLSLPSNGTGDLRSTLYNEGGTNTWAGPVSLSGTSGSVNFSAVAGSLTLSGAINSPTFAGTLQLRGTSATPGTGTLSGVVTLAATAVLNKSDNNTWIIASTGNTWGTLQPQTGTVRLDAVNALPAGSAVNFTGAGTLNLNGNNQSIGNLTGVTGSLLQFGPATLTTTGTSDTTFAGVASGTGGALTKAGTNTLTLTGDNTFTGTTTVTGGTLQLGNNSNAGSVAGPVAMGTGATLSYNRGNDFSYGGSYSSLTAGAGSIRKTNTSVLTLTGSGSTFSGIWDIENGSVVISSGTALGGSGMVLEIAGSGGQTPQLRLSNDITVAVGELRTSGSGALRNLSGNNAITASGNVLLNGGSGASTWTSDAGTLTVSGPVLASSANMSLTLAGAGNGVVSNGIANGQTTNLPLTKSGAGTWTLSGANAYTGATTVSGGTLRVNGSLAAGSAVTVQGGTLGGSGTVNGTVAVTSTGRLAPGNSIGELTVGNTTWAGGGSFELEYQSASADPTTPGTTNDHLKGTTGSSLDLTGVTSGNKFTLDLRFVETGDPTGTAATIVFATFDSITGATPGDVSSLFTVTGQLGASYTPVVLLTDGATDTLSITFVPVPEPTTVLGLAAVALAAGRLARRRRG